MMDKILGNTKTRKRFLWGFLALAVIAGCWGDNVTSPNSSGPKAELTWIQTSLGAYAGDPDYAEVRGTVRNDTDYSARNFGVKFRLKEGGSIGHQYISRTVIPPHSGNVTIVARTKVSHLLVRDTFVEWD